MADQPEPPHTPTKRRSRANTKDLLGDHYLPSTQKPPRTPKPKNLAEHYDDIAVKNSAGYADAHLRSKRIITPSTGQILRFSLDSCKDYLLATSEADKRDCASTIKAAEEAIQYKSCLRLIKSPDAEAMIERILDLRVFAYLARYGDYLGLMCGRLKTRSKLQEAAGWDELQRCQYWTETQTVIEEESRLMNDRKDDRDEEGLRIWPNTPLRNAILAACVAIELSERDTLNMIELYAKRNSTFHTGIQEMLMTKGHTKIALQLTEDINELDKCIPASFAWSKHMLRNIITALIDENFIRHDSYGDPRDPENWLPTPDYIQRRMNHRHPEDWSVESLEKLKKQQEDERVALVAKAEPELKKAITEREAWLAVARALQEDANPVMTQDQQKRRRAHINTIVRYNVYFKTKYDECNAEWSKYDPTEDQ
ncbi:MAG: hypothetical protein M1828_007387 [Chrysothrix sp. TS-e1954]|nr:MAG: hypothetical protein M1828_007387 [Chrysothrix sp. TS-e1954]